MEGVSQRSRGQWQCPLGHSPALHQPSSMSLSVQRRASSSSHLCRGVVVLGGTGWEFQQGNRGPSVSGERVRTVNPRRVRGDATADTSFYAHRHD